MQALQVHYTSCRHGTLGSDGFQVRAVSEGIAPDELREIVGRSAYRRPLLADEPPDDVDYDTVYPVACRFYRLASGRMALTRASYSGVDYSGRAGNLFAHTLVLAPEDMDRRPAEYFLWPGWKRSLSAGEDDGPPPPLAAIPLADLNCPDLFSPDELRRFLGTQPDRAESLRSMVCAVFLGAGDSRSVMIRDQAPDLLYWIACLQRCFPYSIALTLDFSSYEYNTWRTPRIAATVEGSEIAFDQAQRNYQYYVFDRCGGQNSAMPVGEGGLDAAAADYADLVVTLLQHQPAGLDAFFTMAEKLGCRQADADLCLAARIHALARTQTSQVSAAYLADLVRFAVERADGALWRALVPVFEPPLRMLTAAGDSAGIQLRIRMLATAARMTGDKSGQQEAVAAWCSLIESSLAAGRLPVTDVIALRSDVAASGLDGETVLARALTAEDFLRRLAGRISSLPVADMASDLMALVLDAVRVLGSASPLEDPKVAVFLHSLMADGQVFRSVLLSLLSSHSEPAAIAALCRRLAGSDPHSVSLLGGVLAAALPALSPDVAMAVRKGLPQDLVMAEWMAVTDTAPAPVDAFLRFRDQVIDNLPSIGREACAELTTALMERLDERNAAVLARALLSRGKLKLLPKPHLERSLELLNRQIRLDPNDKASGALATAMSDLSAEHELCPNRSRLFQVVQEAGTLAEKFPMDTLGACGQDLAGLDPGEYAALVEFLLEKSVCTPRRRRNVGHAEVIHRLYCTRSADVFTKSYASWLKRAGEVLPPEAMVQLADTWIERDERYRPGRNLGQMAPAVMPVFAAAVAGMSTKERDRFFDDLYGQKQPLTRTFAKRIEELGTLVEEENRSMLGRIGGLIGKGVRRVLGGGH